MKHFLISLLAGLAPAAAHAGPPALDAAMKARAGTDASPAYRHALVDLNNDDYMDAVVLISDSRYCGSGGCTMIIYAGTANGFKEVSFSTVTMEPIFVLPELKNGWHTLSVLVAGGGAQSGQALLKFDGVAYPANPSMEARATSADLNDAQQLKLE